MTSLQTATNELIQLGRRVIEGIPSFSPECLIITLAVGVLRATECCLILEYTGNGIFSFISDLILSLRSLEK